MIIISDREERIGTACVDAAYKVHETLGPGLLEKIYETCFCHELSKRGLEYKRQVSLPIHYDGIIFDEGLRLDVLVEDLVVCELKAREFVYDYWDCQLRSHMNLLDKHLGYLLNFNVKLMRQGIKRFIM